jgi:hypothetical protein
MPATATLSRKKLIISVYHTRRATGATGDTDRSALGKSNERGSIRLLALNKASFD